jgi:hypothetical protein
MASIALECATRKNGDATSQNPPLTYKTSIDIAFQNSTQRMLRNLSSHNLSHRKSTDLTSHNLSTRAKGCTNIVDGNNGNPTMQSHLRQKKNMRKNGNWDNVSLKLAMENIEIGSNL